MSRPAPSNKANFLQTILLMAVVFLGMQLFLGPKGPQTTEYGNKVLHTTTDILAALQDADRNVLEVTAQQKLLPALVRQVDADVAAKQMTRAQGDTVVLDGATLAANAMFKAGLQIDDTGKVRQSYQTLLGYERKMSGNPAWTKPIEVWETKDKQDLESPDKIYNRTIEELSFRNKRDPVWGFIPGGYQFIDFLVHLTGANPYYSFAIAAFLLALAVRGIVFKLAQKQLMFSRQMGQLVPRINEIKERYKDDQPEQQKRIMEMYKEYGINPFAGCLPAFIQMPLFFFVYQCMLHYQFEFTHGYFLWINPDTAKATHGIVAANLGQQDSILIVFYGITMLTSTLLTPVTDPTQKQQQRMMGAGMAVLITVFMFIGLFPVVSGFVLYWTFTNILATAQSLRAYRLPLPPLEKVNAPNGGVYPSKGPKGRWVQMMEDMQRMAEEQRNQQPQAPKADKALPNGDAKQPSSKVDALPSTNGKASKNGSAQKKSPDQDSSSEPKQPKHKPKKRT